MQDRISYQKTQSAIQDCVKQVLEDLKNGSMTLLSDKREAEVLFSLPVYTHYGKFGMIDEYVITKIENGTIFLTGLSEGVSGELTTIEVDQLDREAILNIIDWMSDNELYTRP